MNTRDFIKLKEAYTATIEGNKQDKYRTGNLIELPSKGDVVIMGDLHGNRENFAKVVNAVDLGNHPRRHLIIQEATHTCEVGEDHSYLLHEDIVYLKSKYPDQVHIILGNHELSELTGKEILKGGICYNILFRQAMKEAYGEYYPQILELFNEYIRTMPIACNTKNGIFISHSTPPGKYLSHYSLDFFKKGTGNKEKDDAMIEKVVWGRDLSQESADRFARRVKSEILIVGHTACKRGYQLPNTRHIVLDSKGLFGTSLHFQLHKEYTQKSLVKKGLQFINKKAVKSAIAKMKEEKKARKSAK